MCATCCAIRSEIVLPVCGHAAFQLFRTYDTESVPQSTRSFFHSPNNLKQMLQIIQFTCCSSHVQLLLVCSLTSSASQAVAEDGYETTETTEKTEISRTTCALDAHTVSENTGGGSVDLCQPTYNYRGTTVCKSRGRSRGNMHTLPSWLHPHTQTQCWRGAGGCCARCPRSTPGLHRLHLN